MKLFGIDKQLSELEKWMDDWTGKFWPAKKVTLLVGPTGTGKTASATYIAEKYGFSLCSCEAYDLRDEDFVKQIIEGVHKRPIMPVLYVIEHVEEGDFKILEKVISHTVNPIILTANEYRKVPMFISDRVQTLFYKPVSPGLVAKALEEQGVKNINYKSLSGDVRQSMLSVFGSQSYQNQLDEVEEYLVSGEIDPVFTTLMMLIDNGTNWYKGYELYLFLSAAVLTDRMKRNIMDLVVPSVKKKEYSYYLQKVNVMMKR